MEPATDDPVTLGSYRVVSRLGAGGMGRVLLGVDDTGRRVALKVVHAEFATDPGFRERFRREVQMAARAPVWFTAPVLDSDPDAERPWLATAYVEGPSLQAYIAEQGPLGAAGALALAIQLADGLVALHGAGLVHRDLKPSNVLLAADGPRLIDFGISRAIDSTTMTQTGQLLGTPAYMSPEQAMGDREIGPPSDMFSFGALMVHAATGRSPFAAETATGALFRIVSAEPDLGALTGRLREVVQACLAKDPAARPSAVQVRGRLRDAEPATSPPPGQLPYGAQPPGHHPYGPPSQPGSAAYGSQPGSAAYGGGSQPAGVPAYGPPRPGTSGHTLITDSWSTPPGRGHRPPASRPWAKIAAVLLATVLVGAGAFGVTRLLSSGSGTGTGPEVITTGTAGPSMDPTSTPTATPTPPATKDPGTAIDPATDPRFSATRAAFVSPTTNIACLMTSAEVRCDVRERTWTLPPTPADCQGEFGTGAVLVGSGRGELSCVSDTVAGSSLPTLAYGEAVRLAGVVCTSRDTGMRCENENTGHGFRVSRDTYDVF